MSGSAWRRPKGVLPWLFGTALNLARQHDTRAASDGRLASVLAREGAVPADPIADVIDAVDDAAALERARAALARLSVNDQEVLLLCVVQGFSSAEAAVALGQLPSTVRSRLTRARRRLAAAYTQSQGGST